MIRYLLMLGFGFVTAVMARQALRPAPAKSTAVAPAPVVRTFHAAPAVISEIEDLLARAKQPSRAPAQLRELQRAIDRWLLADPMACIAWLQERCCTGLIRTELLPSVCASAFGGRMAEVLRQALQISDPLLHYAFVTAGFEAAADLHPAEAFEALGTMPPAKRVKLGDALIARWAKQEPRKAWDTVSTGSNPEEVYRLVFTCIAAWDTTDPHGLQEYLRQQLAQPDHKFALEWGLWGLAQQRPSSLLEVLAGYEQHPRLRSIWQSALSNADREPAGIDAALRFAHAQPPGPPRQFALLAIAVGLTSSDHVDRLPEIIEELNPDTRRALEPVRTSSPARFPPPKISAVIDEQFPDGLSRSTAMSTYVGAVLNYQTQALLDVSLDAPSPDSGPDWLDVIAAKVRADPLTSKPGDVAWLSKLNPSTLERLGPELQRRLTPADWQSLQSHFPATQR
jgi:hypothetical protein